MIVPTIIDQARILIESLPDMYAGLTEFTEQISAHVEGFLGEDVLTDGLSQLPGQVSGMISTLLSGAGGMAGGIADGVGLAITDSDTGLLFPERPRTNADAA